MLWELLLLLLKPLVGRGYLHGCSGPGEVSLSFSHVDERVIACSRLTGLH